MRIPRKGSENDGYESMVMLLDWPWEHPINFERFPWMRETSTIPCMRMGPYGYTQGFRGPYPELCHAGLRGQSPQWLTLKNGNPVYFEGSYCSASIPSLSWIVSAEPDYYDRERVIGDPEELTYELVVDVRSQRQNICFMWDGYIVAVYISDISTIKDLWKVIESVQK